MDSNDFVNLRKKFLNSLFCPKCGSPIKDFDEKFITLYNWCLNCNIQFETNLRLEGKYEEYKSNLINKNKESYIRDAKDFFENNIETELSNNEYNEYGIEIKYTSNNKIKDIKNKSLEKIKELESTIK